LANPIEMTYDPQPPPQTGFSDPLELYAKVDEYHKTFVRTDDEVLSQAEDNHRKNELPNIAVSPLQGKLLQILLRQAIAAAPEEKRSRGDIKVLEVGTLAGYSTIWMGRALQGRDGKATGKLITLEFDEKHARVSRENFKNSGLDQIIECRVGTGESGMKKLLEESGGWKGQTDFIFIDAVSIASSE
jgi:predicted O-methyltransferase YrrM